MMHGRAIELRECECHYSPGQFGHEGQCCVRCAVCDQDIKVAYLEDHRENHQRRGEHPPARKQPAKS